MNRGRNNLQLIFRIHLWQSLSFILQRICILHFIICTLYLCYYIPVNKITSVILYTSFFFLPIRIAGKSVSCELIYNIYLFWNEVTGIFYLRNLFSAVVLRQCINRTRKIIFVGNSRQGMNRLKSYLCSENHGHFLR